PPRPVTDPDETERRPPGRCAHPHAENSPPGRRATAPVHPGSHAPRNGRSARTDLLGAGVIRQDGGMYSPDPTRYDTMTYRRTGRSGLDLPAVSLGLWHNFGDDVTFERQEQVLRRAFDLGITHFDLANNYGPPYGAAEENFGAHLRRSFAGLRDELVI